MNGSSFLFRRGDVWFECAPPGSRKRGRYHLVVSSNQNNDNPRVPTVLLARGTRYSSQGPDSNPYSGDCPILYPDPLDRRFFPTTFRFKYSFFQAPHITPAWKSELANASRFRCLGPALPQFLPGLDHELKTILFGYDGRLPSASPRRRNTWPPCLRGGNLVVVHSSRGDSTTAILSHDTIHDHYQHPVVLSAPDNGSFIKNVKERFQWQKLETFDLDYHNHSYSLAGRLPLDDLQALRVLCAESLGVST